MSENEFNLSPKKIVKRDGGRNVQINLDALINQSDRFSLALRRGGEQPWSDASEIAVLLDNLSNAADILRNEI